MVNAPLKSAVVDRRTTAAWVWPTIRATPFRPMVGITGALLVILMIAGTQTSGPTPEGIVVAAYGAIAAAFALGLDDEANRITRPLPTSAVVRLGHRLVLLGPTALASSLILIRADHLLFEEPSVRPSAVGLAALIGTAIAIDVWIGRHRPDEAAEVAAAGVMGWALSGALLPERLALRSVTEAWIDHPWWVAVTSVAFIRLGTAGREA